MFLTYAVTESVNAQQDNVSFDDNDVFNSMVTFLIFEV